MASEFLIEQGVLDRIGYGPDPWSTARIRKLGVGGYILAHQRVRFPFIQEKPFEMVTGQRMHTRYFQVGGVFEDIPVGFEQKVREFCTVMPTRIDQYEALLDRKPRQLSGGQEQRVAAAVCAPPGPAADVLLPHAALESAVAPAAARTWNSQTGAHP